MVATFKATAGTQSAVASFSRGIDSMARRRGIYGPIRRALRDAAARLQAPATWRDLAAAAQVGWDAAVNAVKNMVRAGELVRAGESRVAGSRRPMALYALAQHQSHATQDRTDSVAACMASWSSR